ncbi:MAG: hypothetical protein NEA02_06400 [Thermoanaerobaculia bacterium]|nr:hypothetical protein [Thermoanaerobaculia bacterium]
MRQFETPMVLELSLEKFFATKAGERWTTYELRSFVCRGVTIEALSALQKSSGAKTPPILDLILYLKNHSGKDKKVTVKFELCQGSEVRSASELKQVSVEQGDPRQKHTSLSLNTVTGPDQPLPVLRITLSLFDY